MTSQQEHSAFERWNPENQAGQIVRTHNAQDRPATWLWYPGDLEIWLHREVDFRREERGRVVPPIWRMDAPYANVKFRREYDLEKEEHILIHVEGRYNVTIDNRVVHGENGALTLPAGRHVLMVSVVHPGGVPAIYVEGETIRSDDSWRVTCGNKQWRKPGRWDDFDRPELKPSAYRLRTEPREAVSVERREDGSLFADFGRETFGYIRLHNLQGAGTIKLYYGESREEALSRDHCETTDRLMRIPAGAGGGVPCPSETDGESGECTRQEEHTFLKSRAFRYVQVVPGQGVSVGGVSMLYEYLPVRYRGQFHCSDERLNKIWDVSGYTLHLNTREFFLDGIKRDRWVWSGDAYQSYLMNYYLFFDEAVNRRTMIALRGKDPVEIHLNTILDYSFYWFMGIYDYYMYTGDLQFIRDNYEKMLGLLDFCMKRANAHGMVEGQPGDWVFVDWAEMSKQGELSFEQILYCRSLEIVAFFAGLFGDKERAAHLQGAAERLRRDILDVFWDAEQGGLVHSRLNGELNRCITRYANMFAMMLGFLDEDRKREVANKVLLNDRVQKIKTPYMRFYELAALCEIGEHAYVKRQIDEYWGGMLDCGATSFWEEYDPMVKGVEQYAMYRRPFGKSLCHAWGASPVYLLGKYFLGVRPLSPGYGTYLIEPHLGGLKWMEGVVPAGRADIRVYMDETTIRVTGGIGRGTLRIASETPPSSNIGQFREIKPFYYELAMNQPSTGYVITYTNAEGRKLY